MSKRVRENEEGASAQDKISKTQKLVTLGSSEDKALDHGEFKQLQPLGKKELLRMFALAILTGECECFAKDGVCNGWQCHCDSNKQNPCTCAPTSCLALTAFDEGVEVSMTLKKKGQEDYTCIVSK